MIALALAGMVSRYPCDRLAGTQKSNLNDTKMLPLKLVGAVGVPVTEYINDR